MTPRSRRLVAPLTVGALTLGAAVYVALVDPNEPGHYPLCPTKALTGLDCPACGGLRATHALLRGDVVGALDHNAFVVLVLLPAAVVAWVAWVVRAWREPSAEVPGSGPGGHVAPAPVVTTAPGSASPQADRDHGGQAQPSAGPGVAPALVPARPSAWTDPRLMWALLGAALVFTVVRNIGSVPALQWLASGLGSG